MNWSRGCFRLWVVATIFWVIAVGVFQYETIAVPPIYWLGFRIPEDSTANPQILTAYDDEVAAQEQKAQGNLSEYQIDRLGVLPLTNYYCPVILSKDECVGRVSAHIPKAIAIYNSQLSKERYRWIKFAAGWTFAPPALLFVIGAALRRALSALADRQSRASMNIGDAGPPALGR